MSINRVNNILDKPYEYYKIKPNTQNGVDESFFSTQSQVDIFKKNIQSYQENEVLDATVFKQNLEKIKQEQGLLGNLWDGFKNLTGIGASSSKAQEAIEDYESGLISQEEMECAIDGYQEGQKMAVDVVADIASGILSVGAFVLAVPTGGLSLVAGLGISTAVGAGVKIAIKASDAALGEREYNSKALLYDTVTGVINGLLAPITNGIGNTVTKTVASKIIKESSEEVIEQSVKLGFKQIAKNIILNQSDDIVGGTLKQRMIAFGAGMAADGSLSGAADNIVRAGLEGENILNAGVQGFFGGLIMSPIIGGGFKLAGKAGKTLGDNIFEQNIVKNNVLFSNIDIAQNQHKISNDELVQVFQTLKKDYKYSNKECLKNLKSGVELILNNSDIELSAESLKQCLKLKNSFPILDEKDIVELMQSKFDDVQISRYAEIKEKFGYSRTQEVLASLTDEEIEMHRELSREPDYFSAFQTKIYANARKEVIYDDISKLMALESYTLDEIKKAASAMAETKKSKTALGEINHFRRCNSSDLSHLQYCMVKNRIFDFADFNHYVRSIDMKKLLDEFPLFKEYSVTQAIDFFTYHYTAGTKTFNTETLNLDKELTTYLAENYTDAYQLTSLLNACPLTSRKVGELPSSWLNATDLQVKEQKTNEIYEAISEFQKTKDKEFLASTLKNTLGKDVEVTYAGSGTLGIAYKIAVEDGDTVCLKIFDKGKANYGVSRHGQHIEPQVALFANQHSNSFVHMFFGKVSGLDNNDGFMVTQFLDENTKPIQTATDIDSYYLWCGDNNGDNNIGKTYIDFGKLGITDKDKNAIHLWYKNTYQYTK